MSRQVVVFARISMRGRLLLVLGNVDDVRAGDVVFRLEGDDKRAEFASIVEGWEAGKLAGEAPARTLVCVADVEDYWDLLDGVLGAGEHWRAGIACVGRGEYWDAHEAWEDVWKFLGDGVLRDVLQGLIQFAAACYKPQQVAVDFGDEVGKQRGMGALLGSSARYFERAEGRVGDGVRVGFSVEVLRGALVGLEDVLGAWVDGELGLEDVKGRVADIADTVAGSLEGRCLVAGF